MEETFAVVTVENIYFSDHDHVGTLIDEHTVDFTLLHIHIIQYDQAIHENLMVF